MFYVLYGYQYEEVQGNYLLLDCVMFNGTKYRTKHIEKQLTQTPYKTQLFQQMHMLEWHQCSWRKISERFQTCVHRLHPNNNNHYFWNVFQRLIKMFHCDVSLCWSYQGVIWAFQLGDLGSVCSKYCTLQCNVSNNEARRQSRKILCLN